MEVNFKHLFIDVVEHTFFQPFERSFFIINLSYHHIVKQKKKLSNNISEIGIKRTEYTNIANVPCSVRLQVPWHSAQPPQAKLYP